jgi:hypothetical protein
VDNRIAFWYSDEKHKKSVTRLPGGNVSVNDSDHDKMAFLSGFVKSGLSLLGKDASAFPYTIGPKVEWYENQSIWSLHRGTKKVRHLMNT